MSTHAAPADRPGRGHQPTARVQQLARDLGVDLAVVTGTGIGGRIRLDDVDAAAHRQAQLRWESHTHHEVSS